MTYQRKYAKAKEKKLLKHLKKYKDNPLFLYDLTVPFDNVRSKEDLRKCKNRQKMPADSGSTAVMRCIAASQALWKLVSEKAYRCWRVFVAY